MNAVKYETKVGRGGKVEVTLAGTGEGTPVEVIVLFGGKHSASSQKSVAAPALTEASESSLGFWDNPVDDEVWNTV